MLRAINRKDFLRLGGVGLAGAALVGATNCSRSLSGNKVVRFLTTAEETSIQEWAAIEIQVNRFEEQHLKYNLEREVILGGGTSTVINTNEQMQTTLQPEDPTDVFSYDTGPGFGGVLAEAGLLLPLEDAYQERSWDIYEWAKQRATYNGSYNIDVLAPQNFNEVMFSGFQEVLNGTRSPAEQAAALQDAWAEAKKQGKIATQD
jgi:ABC-type glycerol-3-phosphate transport system substrate-binding protein